MPRRRGRCASRASSRAQPIRRSSIRSRGWRGRRTASLRVSAGFCSRRAATRSSRCSASRRRGGEPSYPSCRAWPGTRRAACGNACGAADPGTRPGGRCRLGCSVTSGEWSIVLLSLKVGAVATLVTLPIAFALAWFLARSRVPGKILIEAVVYLPLVVPPVVTGWMLLLAFAPSGPLGAVGSHVLFRWTGAAIAAGVMALPLMVRAIRLSIEAVDVRLEGAARSLGEFGATITFVSNVPGQTQTLPLAIYAALQRPDGDAIALRLSALSVVIALAALIASELLARRMRARMIHGV